MRQAAAVADSFVNVVLLVRTDRLDSASSVLDTVTPHTCRANYLGNSLSV